jgi:SulP family sulfate permease
MFGQGMSNVITPLFGGVPATAVIARTAVNIRSGGTSRLSTFSHAIFLWAAMMFASTSVAHIPLATLAGVLVATSLRMVEGKRLVAFVRRTPHHFVAVGLTAITTLLLDLIEAVALGIFVAGVVSLVQNRRERQQHQAEIVETEHVIDEILHGDN